MSDSPLHIVFAGGGTGGHLFPGLAVAEQVVRLAPDARITFVGSGKPFEQRHVAAAGFEHLAVPCRPLPQGPREAVSFLLESMAGRLAAGRFLREETVNVVVGLGGYASVPMATAAGRRGVPLVLLEQNTVPGRATRWLARRASLVCVAWAPARSRLRCRCPVQVTGTPIRPCVWDATSRTDLQFVTKRRIENPPYESRERQLLVLGGSGGAQSLNENVPRALYRIRSRLDGWHVLHQSGEQGVGATRGLYRKLALEATVVDFTAEMPSMLAAAELAVCRAGGTTLAELTVAGVPAVLVPYPHATDDHQRHNAEMFARAGAAVMLDERAVVGRLDDHLSQAISQLLGDAARRRRMAAAMRRFGRADAAEQVAAMLLEVVGGNVGRTAQRAVA